MITRNRIISALGAILLGLCLTTWAAEKQPARPAPAWKLQNLEGKTVSLADFKGKVVLLNFWATWCPPCRAEIPDLNTLQKQYADKGLVVIGVAMDQGGRERVANFVKNIGVKYPVVMGDSKIAEAYGGIDAIPTTFIIDRKGNVVDELVGATDRAGFEASIKPAL